MKTIVHVQKRSTMYARNGSVLFTAIEMKQKEWNSDQANQSTVVIHLDMGLLKDWNLENGDYELILYPVDKT